MMKYAAFWLFIVAAFGVLIYSLSGILAPFVAAFILAYILSPLIDSISSRCPISRSVASLLICIFLAVIIIGGMIVLFPMACEQIVIYIKKLPQYARSLNALVTDASASLNRFDEKVAQEIAALGHNFVTNALSVSYGASQSLWSYTVGAVNFFVFLALTPIILLYLLFDWRKLIKNTESLVPVRYKAEVRKICMSINNLLSAYIFGQMNICMILALYYISCFAWLGIDLYLLLGVISGLAVIIPLLGTLLCYLTAMIIGYVDFGFDYHLLYITVIFLIGNFTEGYFLTPKIIGESIGLHPLWIMFAVFALSKLLGFWGLLFAVPIAGIIKIFLSYMVGYYKSTDLYNKID